MASSIPPGGTTFTFLPYIPQQGLGKPIQFRAFIGSISDSFSPQWSEHMDMARADPKFMFNQFTRTINVDFKVMALNKGEHKINLQTVNALAHLCYPTYKSGKGFNGVYVKMVIGDFIKGIGLIQSLDFTVDNESPWIDNLPLYLDCNLSFRFIGKDKPNYKSPNNSGPYYDGKFHEGIK